MDWRLSPPTSPSAPPPSDSLARSRPSFTTNSLDRAALSLAGNVDPLTVPMAATALLAATPPLAAATPASKLLTAAAPLTVPALTVPMAAPLAAAALLDARKT